MAATRMVLNLDCTARVRNGSRIAAALWLLAITALFTVQAAAQAAKDPEREQQVVEQAEDGLLEKIEEEAERVASGLERSVKKELDRDFNNKAQYENSGDKASLPPQDESLADLEREVDQLDPYNK